MLPAHGEYHALVMAWLGNYWIATPGTRLRDNATAILGPASEPQPEAALIIDPLCGGQTGVAADGYATGAPELIVVVVVLRQGVVRWFALHTGTYREVTAGADGRFTSAVFPGLWLDVAALLRLDGLPVMELLRQGLATPEHAAFVQRLQVQRHSGV